MTDRFRFRDFVLDTYERTLRIGAEQYSLRTKTFDVLEFLVRNPGRIVSKDELLANVWEGRFVEESNLPVHISKLRSILQETASNRFIETVSGTGYRFVCRVTAEELELEAEERRAA